MWVMIGKENKGRVATFLLYLAIVSLEIPCVIFAILRWEFNKFLF